MTICINNLITICFASIVLLLSSLVSPASNSSIQIRQQIVIWVSPKGSDNNNGTQQHPVASISKVRDAARKLRQNTLIGDMTVFLRAGIYNINETLEFTGEDSAPEGRKST